MSVKKIVMAGFAVIMAVLAGCGDQEAKPSFTVGFDANFPPYGYKQGTEYVGFDLDLAREVAKRNNWKLVLKPINWDAKDMELNSGMIDCIWNGFTINGREDKYEWSAPYVDNSQVLLVRANSPLRKAAELSGRNVAVQTDTPVQKALTKGGARYADLGSKFRKLVVVPNYNNAIMELEAGSVDAVALDIGVAQDKMKSGSFRMLDEVVISEKYGIGFAKGNRKLRDAVQKTLLEMVKDGTAAKISAKYFNGRDVLIIGK
jgi:polar amino acid transport system substrate-binding protein